MPHKLLRHFFLDTSTAERLSKEGAKMGLSANEIATRYFEIGVSAVDQKNCPSPSPAVVGFDTEASPCLKQISKYKKEFRKHSKA